MALKTISTLKGSTLSFTCTEAESNEGFTREVDLTHLFGVDASSGGAADGGRKALLTLSAIVFAAKTALRNATGGREIDEAEEAVDARIAAWNDGEWGAERSASGESAPFTAGNILSKAVQRVYAAKFAAAADAAAALSAMLVAQLDGKSWDDLGEENQRKARNTFTKAARSKDGAVDSAIAAIQAEQAAQRAAKKANPAGGASLF